MKTAPGGNPWTDGCGGQNGGDLKNMVKLTQSFQIIDAFLDSGCGRMKQDPGLRWELPLFS